MAPIESKEDIKDLKITFESKLTFKKHISNIINQASWKYALIYRISKDIKNKNMILKLFNTYVRPILEYGTIIWASNHNYQLIEKTLKKATRYAMCTPFNHRDTNYKNYEDRLRESKLTNMAQRRKLALMIFIIRIIKNEVHTTYNGIINRLISANRPNTRNNNILTTDHNLIQLNSVLYIGIDCINQYRQVININESTQTIKKKIKMFMLEEQ